MAPVDEIINRVRSENRTILNEFESKEVLAAIGIPIPKQANVLASQGAEAVIDACNQVGYPIVMKLLSDKIVHKSDAGAVKLGISDSAASQEAYDELMSIDCEDDTKGISIQQMASKPIAEIIIGSTLDPQFGPAIMFGIGGVLVEVMKDVAFRIAPINDFDADEMIHEIKGFPLLNGFRGNDIADFDAIKDTLKKVSNLVFDHQEIKEMDLNPLFIYKDKIIAVDARVILK
ncbi:MAG: acetate--CoA ligase family protein [Promethearchaeota archaeon]